MFLFATWVDLTLQSVKVPFILLNVTAMCRPLNSAFYLFCGEKKPFTLLRITTKGRPNAVFYSFYDSSAFHST